MSARPGRKGFFTLAEAAALCGGRFFPSSAAGSVLSRNFEVDSRLVESGDVFVALKGERTDGHEFVESALRNGASAVVVNEDRFDEKLEYIEKAGVPALIVKDGEQALAALASEWLDRVSPDIVGITGSVGKTTTREFLYAAIEKGRRVHSAVKSYNTLIGCSMTILGMPEDTDVLILELGTNHPGEIGELVENFPVTHAVITEVAPAHLEGLKSIEGVLAAKMEITRSSRLKFLSYNLDSEALAAAVSAAELCGARGESIEKVGVGFSVAADVLISGVKQIVGEGGSPKLTFSLSDAEGAIECAAGIFGSQHAKNIAFAYSVSRALGAEPEEFASALPKIELPPGRGRVYKGSSGGLVIDESYNANPSSVSRALKNVLDLDLPDGFRRIAVLGGMRELGGESDYWHEVIMSRASLFDEVYLIGVEWDSVKTMQSSLKGRFADTGSFADFIGGGAEKFEESVVLIKGSRYYEMEKLLPLLTSFLQGGSQQ